MEAKCSSHPMFKSDQMITCSIKVEGRDDEFIVSFVYASNFMEERKVLWRDIRDHHDSPIFRHKPWLIFDDFNEILEVEEHSNFVISPHIPPARYERFSRYHLL